LNAYVLEYVSLIGDLLVGISTAYLKIIDAFVIPGAVALYAIPERFGLIICDRSPGFKVACRALHDTDATDSEGKLYVRT
jgi:hypothetical protein